MYARRSPSPASARTKEKIVASVRAMLADGSFHESTVEQVAAHAGVSRATLYQHFGSRLDLVDAMCDLMAENPALVALRGVTSIDDLVALSVEFWSTEEPVLVQLYGAAAVDPAAQGLVERQRRDRHSELRKILHAAGKDDKRTFAELAVLTSFETYVELRRSVGLSLKDVTATLQDAAHRLLA